MNNIEKKEIYSEMFNILLTQDKSKIHTFYNYHKNQHYFSDMIKNVFTPYLRELRKHNIDYDFQVTLLQLFNNNVAMNFQPILKEYVSNIFCSKAISENLFIKLYNYINKQTPHYMPEIDSIIKNINNVNILVFLKDNNISKKLKNNEDCYKLFYNSIFTEITYNNPKFQKNFKTIIEAGTFKLYSDISTNILTFLSNSIVFFGAKCINDIILNLENNFSEQELKTTYKNLFSDEILLTYHEFNTSSVSIFNIKENVPFTTIPMISHLGKQNLIFDLSNYNKDLLLSLMINKIDLCENTLHFLPSIIEKTIVKPKDWDDVIKFHLTHNIHFFTQFNNINNSSFLKEYATIIQEAGLYHDIKAINGLVNKNKLKV